MCVCVFLCKLLSVEFEGRFAHIAASHACIICLCSRVGAGDTIGFLLRLPSSSGHEIGESQVRRCTIVIWNLSKLLSPPGGGEGSEDCECLSECHTSSHKVPVLRNKRHFWTVGVGHTSTPPRTPGQNFGHVCFSPCPGRHTHSLSRVCWMKTSTNRVFDLRRKCQSVCHAAYSNHLSEPPLSLSAVKTFQQHL